jgi:hypothetical protein
MSRMYAAPHQIALPLIALFIAVIRIVISVVVGCVETESDAYPKSRSETAVMEIMEAPSMEGVSAAMEAAPWKPPMPPPWKPPPPKPPRAEAISGLSTQNEASASKAIIVLRNIAHSPDAIAGCCDWRLLRDSVAISQACSCTPAEAFPSHLRDPEQALATAANAFCERSTRIPDILRRNYSFKPP